MDIQGVIENDHEHTDYRVVTCNDQGNTEESFKVTMDIDGDHLRVYEPTGYLSYTHSRVRSEL